MTEWRTSAELEDVLIGFHGVADEAYSRLHARQLSEVLVDDEP
jgi:hypothetical protein